MKFFAKCLLFVFECAYLPLFGVCIQVRRNLICFLLIYGDKLNQLCLFITK